MIISDQFHFNKALLDVSMQILSLSNVVSSSLKLWLFPNKRDKIEMSWCDKSIEGVTQDAATNNAFATSTLIAWIASFDIIACSNISKNTWCSNDCSIG